MFFTNLQFVYWRTPPSSIGHFFEIWAPLFLTINKLFTLKHLNWKMATKKGHDYTTEISCLSCPISMVSVLTLAGGYKLFSGLLYWSAISVSGGWMLCTIHNAIELSFEFSRQYYNKCVPRIMLKYVGWRKFFTASNPVSILYTNVFAFSIGFYEVAKRWAYLRPPFEPQKCFPSPGRSSPSPT